MTIDVMGKSLGEGIPLFFGLISLVIHFTMQI